MEPRDAPGDAERRLADLRAERPAESLLDALRRASAALDDVKGAKREAKKLAKLPDLVDTLRRRVRELPLRGLLARALDAIPRAKVRDNYRDDGDENELVAFAAAVDRGAVAADADGADDAARAETGGDARAANLRLFLDRATAALDEDADLAAAPDGGRVWLGTIHQAKGREFPFVVLARANNDVLPRGGTRSCSTSRQHVLDDRLRGLRNSRRLPCAENGSVQSFSRFEVDGVEREALKVPKTTSF